MMFPDLLLKSDISVAAVAGGRRIRIRIRREAGKSYITLSTSSTEIVGGEGGNAPE